MTKYTINKVFEKKFINPVWKIQVDYTHNKLAVESRNTASTLPFFTIYSFAGDVIWDEYPMEEKEWTLESIQGDFVILKKYGTSSPIQAGIQIIQVSTKKVIANFSEYVLKEVYKDVIVATHRSIPAGLLFYINIEDGTVKNSYPKSLINIDNNIEYPSVFSNELPVFMKDIEFIDNIWIQKHKDIFIWTAHQKKDQEIILKMFLTSKSQILNEKVVINNLDRLIHQPYFKVKDKIFFLTHTKQEISTYLV